MESAETTAEEISSEGGSALPVACDVTDPPSIEAALAATTETFSLPAILVNNAGIAHVGTATNTSEEDFDRIMKVNAKGAFLCLRAVLPALAENGGGSVLNLASIASKLGISERFVYSASKGAILAMTLSVAKDFIGQGIRCNCVCPGRVRTPFVDGFLKKYYPDDGERSAKFKELSEYQPIGRMGEPGSGQFGGFSLQRRSILYYRRCLRRRRRHHEPQIKSKAKNETYSKGPTP